MDFLKKLILLFLISIEVATPIALSLMSAAASTTPTTTIAATTTITLAQTPTAVATTTTATAATPTLVTTTTVATTTTATPATTTTVATTTTATPTPATTIVANTTATPAPSISATPSTSITTPASSSAYGVLSWNVTCKEGGCCDEANVGLTPLKYTQYRNCSPSGSTCTPENYALTRLTSCPEKTTDCALCLENGAGTTKALIGLVITMLVTALLF